MPLTRHALKILMGIACLGALNTSFAQAFPSKPIRLLIGNAAGGAVDGVARLLAERLSSSLGRPVIVEPRPGAGGVLAAETVAKAPPDGHTLGLLGVGALAVNPVAMKTISYNVATDFTYLGGVATIPLALIVNPNLPVNNLAEFQALLKKNPGKFSYGSSGIGGPLHLAMEAYKQRAGVYVVHVPYRGGAPAVTDVMAGHIPMMFLDIQLAAQQAQAGKVRALATVSGERSPLLPQTPTFKEAGMPDFNYAAWLGIAAPAGLPAAVESRLASALKDVTHSPDFHAKLQAIGYAGQKSDASEFKMFVGREAQRYRQLVEAQKIRIEE